MTSTPNVLFDGDIDKKSDLGYLLHRLEVICREKLPVGPPPPVEEKKEVPPPLASPSPSPSPSPSSSSSSSSAPPAAAPPTAVTYWAKGTGFGHSNASKATWDVQSYVSAQRRRDLQIQDILQAIHSITITSLSPDQKKLLESSSLFSLLENFLENDSLLDLAHHSLLYLGIFTLLRSLFSLPELAEVVKKRSQLTSCVEKLNSQAKLFLSRLKSHESISEMELATEISECWKNLSSLLNTGQVSVSMETDNPFAQLDISLENPDRVYMRIFPPFQFGTYSMKKQEGGYNHHYHNFLKDNAVHSKDKLLRLAQEASALSSSLPLTPSSSVFLNVDEERLDLMQCLITGPSETPYDNGVFQFDIYFPPDYPNCPPLCNLQTTGGGAVRFNPNLYNCGKVCLSLLGTWSGAEGENWNKETATLLQVLVSVQSLIFVPEPYFNEPGYERQIGTKMGEEASRKYSETIRLGTAEHAILGQLKCPSPGFEKIIKTHFFLKKDYVLKTVGTWVEDAKLHNSNNLVRFTKAFADIQQELDKIGKSDTLLG